MAPLPCRFHGLAPLWLSSPHVQPPYYLVPFGVLFEFIPATFLVDTSRILVLQTVQSFSGSSESLCSPRLSTSSRLYSWANALVPEPANIQPNLVGWHHLTRLEPYFQGSNKKCVLGSGKLGAPKYPCSSGQHFSDCLRVHDRSLSMHHRYWNTKSMRCKSGLLNQNPAILSLRHFTKTRSIEKLSSLDPKP